MSSEDELQEMVERGLPIEGKEAETYRNLFRLLGREKEIPLSADFANVVIKRVKAKQRRRAFLEEYVLLFISIIIVLAGALYCLLKTNAVFSLGFLSGISDYAGVLCFGIGFVLVLNFFEKRLVRRSEEKL